MDMKDRELLELAAKAAGMAPPYDEHGIFSAWVGDPVHGHWWDPLGDDGDALRLAVKLDLTIYRPGSHPGVLVVTDEAHTTHSDDCVRRAIVIAAAEIGKAMEEQH